MEPSTLLGIVVAGVLIWLIGNSWIDSFFRRKEELIRRISGVKEI